jgi:hypothetical protein
MEISPLKFQFELTPEDLRSIRDAIRRWGKPTDCVEGFNGAELYRHFERWQLFVDTNWADWDISEYSHDVGCRYWIQVAIEHSCPATRLVLEHQVEPIDTEFRAHMKAAKRPDVLDRAPFSKRPYFWETHTIHPEL